MGLNNRVLEQGVQTAGCGHGGSNSRVWTQGVQTAGCGHRGFKQLGVDTGESNSWVWAQGVQTDGCGHRGFKQPGADTGGSNSRPPASNWKGKERKSSSLLGDARLRKQRGSGRGPSVPLPYRPPLTPGGLGSRPLRAVNIQTTLNPRGSRVEAPPRR